MIMIQTITEGIRPAMIKVQKDVKDGSNIYFHHLSADNYVNYYIIALL